MYIYMNTPLPPPNHCRPTKEACNPTWAINHIADIPPALPRDSRGSVCCPLYSPGGSWGWRGYIDAHVNPTRAVSSTWYCLLVVMPVVRMNSPCVFHKNTILSHSDETGNIWHNSYTYIIYMQMWCSVYKGGHSQFKSAPPQLRNIADNQIDCGVAD
jgi:hypothetical protein